MSDVLDRFIKYCAVPSQSNPLTAEKVPSTPEQFDIANVIAQDLRELGAEDVAVDEHAYVTAHWPASEGCEDLPCLGFCCHIDTAWQSVGSPVHPEVKHYEGGELRIGTDRDGREVVVSPETNPQLANMAGWDIVTTDGTSLLGGDDKAGDAMVVSLLARLKADPSLPHPRLALSFVPDEEIGHGAALLDLASFGCAYAYTVDGGPVGELEWECFNAAEATVSFEGFSIHPGDAKDRMVNAANLLVDYQGLLPAAQRPEHTAGYEGFMHLMSVSGTVAHATARYIVRDHDAAKFERKLELMRAAADFLNTRLGEERVHVEFKREYRNMAEVVGDHPELIERAEQAFSAAGVVPKVIPIRGGTDGAQLSFRGLPCPNLSTGAYCCHGVNEFIPVSSLEKMVDVLVELVGRFA